MRNPDVAEQQTRRHASVQESSNIEITTLIASFQHRNAFVGLRYGPIFA